MKQQKSARGDWIRKSILGAIPPLTLILIWGLASTGETLVIPSIGQVRDVLIHPFTEPPNMDSLSLADSTVVSLLRVGIGFFAALIIAVPLGVWVGRSRFAREFFTPMMELVRPVSPVAWMPLAIILLGFSSFGTMFYGRAAWQHDWLDQLQLAIVVIISWGAFFPIYLNTVYGVMNVKQLYIEVAQVNGARGFQMLRHVIIPAALPSIMVGIRLGMGKALMIIVAAEFFPGTRAGLGYFITSSHQVAQYEYAFASIVVIALAGLLINIVLQWIEDRVSRWQVKER